MSLEMQLEKQSKAFQRDAATGLKAEYWVGQVK